MRSPSPPSSIWSRSFRAASYRRFRACWSGVGAFSTAHGHAAVDVRVLCVAPPASDAAADVPTVFTIINMV